MKPVSVSIRALGACTCIALALTVSGSVHAQAGNAAEKKEKTEQTERIEQLRAEFAQQLQALQQQYEERLQALEARLAMQALPPQPQAQAAAVEAPVAAASPASVPASAGNVASAYNPEISLVLQGAWRRQQDIAERQITGFTGGAHAHGDSSSGFGLDGSELLMSANIDPRFRGHMNLVFADDEVEVEEAWFQSLGLGNGLTLKGGRFLSGIGYANEQHAHAWDFADQSLMYRALFGEHLRQDGVQLKWLAPTATWLEFGAELGRGQFFPGSDAAGRRNGAGSWAAFAHLGDDIGASHSWRAGIGYVAARPKQREAHLEDSSGIEASTAFSGDSQTWLADFVWKWALDGGSGQARSFKLQGELFRRAEDGLLSCADNLADGGACAGQVDAYRARQSGGYLQGVWQFMPEWRLGYRYDRLHTGSVGFAGLPFAATAYRPLRHSLMADWSPSEFSRLRLQFARDQAQQGLTDNQLTLQYIFSLGAHGAHKY